MINTLIAFKSYNLCLWATKYDLCYGKSVCEITSNSTEYSE